MSIVRAQVAAEFKATGVERVKQASREISLTAEREARRVGTSTEAMGSQFGGAARQMAFALENMARTGNVTGESLKQVAAQGANIAFMFGAQGAIAGAAAVGVLAIVSYFRRARDEMQETREKFIAELTQMVNAGDNAGMMKRLRDLDRGTPAGGFRDGLSVMRRQEQMLEDSMNAAPLYSKQRREFRLQLEELRSRIRPLQEEFDKLRQAILNVNNTPLEIRGLPGMTTSADAPGRKGKPEKFAAGSTYGLGLPTPKAGILADLMGLPNGDFNGIDPAITAAGARMVAANMQAIDRQAAAEVQAFTALQEAIRNGIAGAVTMGLSAGFDVMFSQGGNIGQAFAALGGSMISALGSMVMQFGTEALAASIAANTALSAIFTPAGPAAAIALIAIGAAMRAAGSRVVQNSAFRGGSGGGGGGSYGGYAGGGSSGVSVIDRGVITMGGVQQGSQVAARNPVTNNVVIIGPDDPTAQRMWRELQRKSEGRGSL